jgi:membrane protein implicated in regulation of membrane protease activity
MARLNKIDWSLLVQLLLIFLLVLLGTLFYWRPAAAGTLDPAWWHAVLLSTLFFACVWVISYRRRQRGRSELRRSLRDGADSPS